MNTERLTAFGALLVALGLYALSALPENSEAYLFPRLIGIGMAIFAVALIVASFFSAAEDQPIQSVPWLVIAPGLAVFVAYLYAVEVLGFYVSAFVAFFAIITIYAPERRSLRGWGNRSCVAILFIGAIYAIFGLLLKVQTPTGVFI